MGRKMNIVQQCVCIYINAKMRPVETVPGISEGAWGRELEGEIQV
jgi:hypothetical protein